MTSPNTQETHRWSFVRLGGFDQVVLDSGADIAALHQLDKKLWGALASPVKGTYLDEETMRCVDTDGDERIRAPEVLEAVSWSTQVFEDLGDLTARVDGLPLSRIRQDTELGKRVYAGAERLLGAQHSDSQIIKVHDTTRANEVLYAMPFNGDGVITLASLEEHAEAEALREIFGAIVSSVGSVLDRSGEQGIEEAHISAFYESLSQYDQWWRAAEDREDDVIPLGDATAHAVEAFERVRAKIQDYFVRCELVAFDPRAQPHLIGHESQWIQLADELLDEDTASVEEFPLSMVAPGQPLTLREGINPGWRAEMKAFVAAVVVPLCGEGVEELTHEEWDELVIKFEPYTAWLGRKRGVQVESLGIARIRELLSGSHEQALRELVARDLEVKPEADIIGEVDRAARYHRDLHALLENFVNFRDFYNPDRLAIFQSGVLYLDARSCALCIDVDRPDAHVAMAQRSYAYLAYCECRRKGHEGTRHIVAAFTDGDNDFLIKGRNGIFYDREGRDWDAKITQIVEQPISIRQAFWSPYKRLFRFISGQIESFTAERDAQTQKQLDTTVGGAKQSLTEAASAKPGAVPTAGASARASTAGPTSFDIARYAGIFAAIGIAAGFILSSITLLVTAFFDLEVWQMPLVLCGVVLVISGPSMVLAAFKLHQRHLAPLLDANGWAVNTRARLNIPFGAALTDVAELPEGARHTYFDPYRERRTWPWVVGGVSVALGALLVWWLVHQGLIELTF